MKYSIDDKWGLKTKMFLTKSKYPFHLAQVKQQEDVQHENMHEKVTRIKSTDCSTHSVTTNESGQPQEYT